MSLPELQLQPDEGWVRVYLCACLGVLSNGDAPSSLSSSSASPSTTVSLPAHKAVDLVSGAAYLAFPYMRLQLKGRSEAVGAQEAEVEQEEVGKSGGGGKERQGAAAAQPQKLEGKDEDGEEKARFDGSIPPPSLPLSCLSLPQLIQLFSSSAERHLLPLPLASTLSPGDLVRLLEAIWRMNRQDTGPLLQAAVLGGSTGRLLASCNNYQAMVILQASRAHPSRILWHLAGLCSG